MATAEPTWLPTLVLHLQEAAPLFAAADAEYCSIGFDSFEVQPERSSGCLQVRAQECRLVMSRWHALSL